MNPTVLNAWARFQNIFSFGHNVFDRLIEVKWLIWLINSWFKSSVKTELTFFLPDKPLLATGQQKLICTLRLLAFVGSLNISFSSKVLGQVLRKKKAKQIPRLATNSTWYSCTSNAITPRNFVVCSDGLHQIPALIIMQSTLSKTDTFGTGTSCPSYRKSIEGAKKGRDQL